MGDQFLVDSGRRVEPSGDGLGNTRPGVNCRPSRHRTSRSHRVGPRPRAHRQDLPEPRWTRRTSDLVRLLTTLAFMALLVLAGSLGSGDDRGAPGGHHHRGDVVPALVVSILATLNSLIVLALPIYILADLAIRRRWRMLVTAWPHRRSQLIGAEAVRALRGRSDRRCAAGRAHPAGRRGGRVDRSGVRRLRRCRGAHGGRGARAFARGPCVVVWSALVALGVLFLIDLPGHTAGAGAERARRAWRSGC